MKASIIAAILIGSMLPSAVAEPAVEELSQRVTQLEKTVEELAKALAFLAEKPVMKGAVPAKPEVVVNVGADGGIFVAGEKLTPDELEEKLKVLFEANQNQLVKIRGDRDTTYQRIVEIIDICQKAGLWNISFATERNKDSQPDKASK